MKYVQIGILAAIVVCAGLLFQIYRQQQPAAVTAEETVELAVTSPAAGQPEALEPKAAPAQKPHPVRRAKEKSRPAVSKPAPVEPAVVAPPPAPVVKPVAPAEPIPPTPVVEAERPAPPEPRRITLPEGTPVIVRLEQRLSTDHNYGGDTFRAALDQPLIADGLIVANKGARVEGHVVESERAGRVKGLSTMAIELVRLHTADGQVVEISTGHFQQDGEKSAKQDAAKIGIGAGLGALIGGIAGGGKGAAIGAGVGAGAGGATVAATRGKAVEFPVESRLEFRLTEPVEIVEEL